MREANRRAPEFEALETMTLLSGTTIAAHPAIEALAGKTSLPNPLVLSGSVHGTFMAKGVTGGSVAGSGKLSPVGKVTVKGNVVVVSASAASETLSLSTSKGKASIIAHFAATGPASFMGTYHITGGTKAFAGEMGSGTVLVSLTASKFNSTFSPTPPTSSMDMNK